MKTLIMLMLLGTLTRCTTALPPQRPEYQELMVTQHVESAYARAMQAVSRHGLQVTHSSDAAQTFTATRRTGERVTVTVQRLAFTSLVTISGTPAHDVGDIVRAYQTAQ